MQEKKALSLEGKPRTPLSSRVATRVSWSPLSARASSAKTRGFHTQLDEGPETEGLLFLHGLESNPGSSLQTEEEAGLP